MYILVQFELMSEHISQLSIFMGLALDGTAIHLEQLSLLAFMWMVTTSAGPNWLPANKLATYFRSKEDQWVKGAQQILLQVFTECIYFTRDVYIRES